MGETAMFGFNYGFMGEGVELVINCLWFDNLLPNSFNFCSGNYGLVIGECKSWFWYLVGVCVGIFLRKVKVLIFFISCRAIYHRVKIVFLVKCFSVRAERNAKICPGININKICAPFFTDGLTCADILCTYTEAGAGGREKLVSKIVAINRGRFAGVYVYVGRFGCGLVFTQPEKEIVLEW